MQTAVRIHRWQASGFSGIQVDKVEIPNPGADDVLVRWQLRPVQPDELLALIGNYPVFQPDLPAVPGCDGMGVVEAVGDHVKDVKPGQRVAAASPVAMRPLGKGTFQQYSAVPQTALVAVPDSVSDETAAQFMINPGVALQLLKLCPIPKGQYLLQNAAGSVVGRILIALANFYGFKTISVVRRPAAKQQLLALGGNVVIDSRTENVLQRVSEVTQGQGAYAAFDAIGGTASQQILSAVRDEGTMVVYGVLSGLTMQTDITDVLFKHKVIKGFSLTRWFRKATSKEQQAFCAELMSLLENGTIKLPAGQEFPLDDPIPAYEALASQPGGLKLMLRG